jgi:hypothetical protein
MESAQGKKRAVVVGINYKGSPYQLNGCEKDAMRMKAHFESLKYEVLLLTATEVGRTGKASLAPTKRNIAAAIRETCATPGLAKMGFFFAGHGTQMRDHNGDEKDGMDEALVCQGLGGPQSRPSDADLYRDDDIIALFHASLTGKNVDAFLMFDACHSGTVGDLGWLLGRQGPWVREAGHVTTAADGYRMLCFSAAQDNECALETAGGGNMTNKFLSVANKGKHGVEEYRASFARMSCQMPSITASRPLGAGTEFGVRIAVDGGGSRGVAVVARDVCAPGAYMRLVLRIGA